MQNRSNIVYMYIHIRKVAMGAVILDFDRWSHVHALNVCSYRVRVLNRQQLVPRAVRSSWHLCCTALLEWMGLCMLIGVHCFWAFRFYMYLVSLGGIKFLDSRYTVTKIQRYSVLLRYSGWGYDVIIKAAMAPRMLHMAAKSLLAEPLSILSE